MSASRDMLAVGREAVAGYAAGADAIESSPLPYPADRNRGTSPTARAWAVARGTAPGSHYALTEQWADMRGRYGAGEIVTRGLTEAEALAHAYALNQCANGGPGAGERVQSGGT